MSAFAVGCGASTGATRTTSTFFRYPDVELPTAQEAAMARGSATNSHLVSIGATARLQAGVSVELAAVSIGDGDPRGPWLDARVRLENVTGNDLVNPSVGIVCTGSPEIGGLLTGSMPHPRGAFASGVHQAGTLRLVLPGATRVGDAIPRCETPAVVRVIAQPVDSNGDDEVSAVDFAIPDRLVARLNVDRTHEQTATSSATRD